MKSEFKDLEKKYPLLKNRCFVRRYEDLHRIVYHVEGMLEREVPPTLRDLNIGSVDEYLSRLNEEDSEIVSLHEGLLKILS